jgi:hypothetical protein
MLPNNPLKRIKTAAYGGAHVADWVHQLVCPRGPIPLAARGLTAVLARALPARTIDLHLRWHRPLVE